MFHLHYIPDGASSKPSPNHKLSQLIKPTNISKRKNEKQNIYPSYKSKLWTITINFQQTKLQQNTQHLNKTNKKSKTQRKSHIEHQHSQVEHILMIMLLNNFSNRHNNPYILWAQTTNTANQIFPKSPFPILPKLRHHIHNNSNQITH